MRLAIAGMKTDFIYARLARKDPAPSAQVIAALSLAEIGHHGSSWTRVL